MKHGGLHLVSRIKHPARARVCFAQTRDDHASWDFVDGRFAARAGQVLFFFSSKHMHMHMHMHMLRRPLHEMVRYGLEIDKVRFYIEGPCIFMYSSTVLR
jgi:hypothetical protein